jgi:iron complex outermembrane receptor protein
LNANVRVPRTRIAQAAAGAIALLVGTTAQAQEAAKAEAEEVSTVVVTAQKREEKLQDVPVAITALSGKQLLRDDTIKTANDITQFIPNAQASATDGRTRPRWFLRGIGTNETAASTVSPIGIYNDEVYLNNVYIQGFPLFDSERVEVLRGPQGTLWGKNTTGGAIHYISRKPAFETDGYAKVGIGSFGEKTFQGAVGGPIVDDRFAARISFYNESRDGWVTNEATGRKDGAVKDQAVRAQVLWLPVTGVDALLTLKTRSLDGDKSPSFYLKDNTPGQTITNPVYAGPLNDDTIAQAGRFEEVLDSDGASLKVNWNIDNYTLTSISAYDSGNRVLWGGSPIAIDISRSRAESHSRQATQEVRLTSPREDRWNWIAGLYLFKEVLTTNQQNRSDAVAGASPSSTSPTATSPFAFNLGDTSQNTESYALFGSTTFKIDEQWSVSGGLRKSVEKKEFAANYQAAPSNATFKNNVSEWWQQGAVSALNPKVSNSDSATWDEVTYDITPQWKINPNVNAYLRYAHGFRAGGFVENNGVITRLDPETLNGTELGFKTQWLDGRLTFNTAIFNYDYKDIIVGVLLPVPGTTTTRQVQENAATGYSRGAEFEVAYAVLPKLRVGGSLGLLKTRYTDYSSSASGQTINATGNRFTRAPETSVTFNVEYREPLGDGAQVGAATDWSWRSKQYFNAVNQTNPLLSQDAYALGNARLFYRAPGGRVEVSAFVRNLTDETYSVLATGPSQGRTREVYGLPRSFGLSATWLFL